MMQTKPDSSRTAKRKLPIGIQTFREIREENCYYVDKTAYIARLVDEGKHYFLSRPRRFGKSLFLDTLKELFEGNEPLFEGLAIHERWDWSVRHPMLRLDFSRNYFKEPDQLQEDVIRLGYPNREVQQSLNKSLLNHLTSNPARRAEHSARLYDLLLVNDFDGLETLLEAFFASIPYQWHTNNEIADYEGYYASVFYSYFASLGLSITVEASTRAQPRDSSRAGRLDMAVEFNGQVYLFEFKVVERAAEGAALRQLQERDYAAKYRGRGAAIHLIGVEFSREKRNVVAFEVERA